MTEYEKSQAGMPHTFDAEMMRMFKNACRLTRLYNQTSEDEEELRRGILTELLGKFGEGVYIVPDFHCEYGSNITIGDHVTINMHCILMDNAPITIGSDVLIGPNVSLYTVNHSLNPSERAHGICTAKPIRIEDGVWLCGDVQITPGVTIGKNSVIGTGSVVTHDIPAGVVAAGNPCRVLRKL